MAKVNVAQTTFSPALETTALSLQFHTHNRTNELPARACGSSSVKLLCCTQHLDDDDDADDVGECNTPNNRSTQTPTARAIAPGDAFGSKSVFSPVAPQPPKGIGHAGLAIAIAIYLTTHLASTNVFAHECTGHTHDDDDDDSSSRVYSIPIELCCPATARRKCVRRRRQNPESPACLMRPDGVE